MRKLIMFNMVTLDGFFAGPNGELDWHHVDEEFNDFAITQLKSADGLVFGRVTYEMMASYWPTEAADKDDPTVAALMNSIPKVVASRTLAKADWNNSSVIGQNVAREISQLKEQPGKDMLLFGSADLASSLRQLGLIDEYRVVVNPVVLGRGKPLFKNVEDRFNLQLTNARPFRSGNVLLYYRPNDR